MKTNKKQILLEILEKNKGLIYLSCKEVGITPTTYYVWKEKDPKFKEAVDNIINVEIDKVESKLLECIDSGDLSAIKFYLSHKKSEYKDKQEIDLNCNDFEIKI